MITYELYLEQPSDTNIETMPEGLQEALSGLFVEYPNSVATYTKVVTGRKVIHARIKHDNLTVQTLNDMFAAFGLDWSVMYLRGAYKVQIGIDGSGEESVPIMGYDVLQDFDKAALLPFMQPIIVEGEVTFLPLISDSWLMPVYSGEEPINV